MNAIVPQVNFQPKPGYKLKHLILSHSSLDVLHSCDRKFEFRKMYGTSNDREEAFVTEVGHALHAGYEMFLMCREDHPDIRERKAIHAMCMRYPYQLEATTKNSSQRSLEACYNTLMAMLSNDRLTGCEVIYIKTKDRVERPAVEVPFAMKVMNSPFPLPVFYVGFIDCVLYDRMAQKYIVMDIKTTRRYIKDYSARYEFDEQCIPYAIVLEQLLEKPIEALDVAYISVFIDLEEPKVQVFDFHKPPQYVRDWHRGLCMDIDRITQQYNAQWFKRTSSGEKCIGWGTACFFLDYCMTRDPEVASKMIQGTVQEELFSTGAEPWVTVEIPYQQPFAA